jgi:uncharacterized surface protein with fasciclin (FAS1) repeats
MSSAKICYSCNQKEVKFELADPTLGKILFCSEKCYGVHCNNTNASGNSEKFAANASGELTMNALITEVLDHSTFRVYYPEHGGSSIVRLHKNQLDSLLGSNLISEEALAALTNKHLLKEEDNGAMNFEKDESMEGIQNLVQESEFLVEEFGRRGKGGWKYGGSYHGGKSGDISAKWRCPFFRAMLRKRATASVVELVSAAAETVNLSAEKKSPVQFVSTAVLGTGTVAGDLISLERAGTSLVVFAPVNEAFVPLADQLKKLPLDAILRQHVVAGSPYKDVILDADVHSYPTALAGYSIEIAPLDQSPNARDNMYNLLMEKMEKNEKWKKLTPEERVALKIQTNFTATLVNVNTKARSKPVNIVGYVAAKNGGIFVLDGVLVNIPTVPTVPAAAAPANVVSSLSNGIIPRLTSAFALVIPRGVAKERYGVDGAEEIIMGDVFVQMLANETGNKQLIPVDQFMGAVLQNEKKENTSALFLGTSMQEMQEKLQQIGLEENVSSMRAKEPFDRRGDLSLLKKQAKKNGNDRLLQQLERAENLRSSFSPGGC